METIPCAFVQKESLLPCPEFEVANADCEVREVVLDDKETLEDGSISTA